MSAPVNAASPKGTFDYSSKFPHITYSELGPTELMVSNLGFGGYRIHEHDPDHREALKHALKNGINLIDTSSNYTDGSSERLIGQVLHEEFESGQLLRQQIVLVTKVGYVQGQNLKQAKQKIKEQSPYPDMVEFHPECWHNISPEFLRDQITLSLQRLQVDRIDILLLHNPEYFLKTNVSRDIYYARLQKAFAYLEEEVSAKRISYYGISSNTFIETENKSDFTSLARVYEIAKSIQKNHHFAVIQFPLNLYETGAVTLKNNDGQSVLQFAADKKIGTLANRPLNAFFRGRLLRLASFAVHDEVEIKGQMHQLMGRAIELERQYTGDLREQFKWAQFLKEKHDEIDDVLNWRDALYQQIYPSLNKSLARIEPQFAQWGAEYRQIMADLLNLITKDLESLANQKTKISIDLLHEAAPQLKSQDTLSKKALSIYRSLKGLNCVLVGMKKQHYVDDCLQSETPLDGGSAVTLTETETQKALSNLARK